MLTASITELNHSYCVVLVKGKRVKAYFQSKRLTCKIGDQVEITEPTSFDGTSRVIKVIRKEQNYDVVVEAMVPAKLTYRVKALSAEEALQKAKTIAPSKIDYNIRLKKPLRAIIYDAGSSLIRLSRSLLDYLF
jgi:hypothetical protein